MILVFTATSFAIWSIALPWKSACCGIAKQLFSIMKCLLEQGDPFVISAPTYRLLRVTLIGIFAACTVLSNAYKNDNIYRMVLPRTRLKYERLIQLRKENFTYFSAIGPVSFDIHSVNKKFPVAWRKKGSEFARLIPYIWDWMIRDEFRSEALASMTCFKKISNETSSKLCAKFIVQTETSAVFNFYHFWGYEGYSQVARWLWHKAGIPKSLLKITKISLDRIWPSVPTLSDVEFTMVNQRIKAEFFANEQAILIDELHKCHNLAVILPTWKAIKYKDELNMRGRPVDIGREAFSSGIVAVFVDGYVTLEYMRRVGAVQEAGIINWWHQLLDPSRDRLTETDTVPVSAPKLTGNILLIFMLWCYGLSGCLVILCLEVWVPTCKLVFKYIRIVVVQLLRIFKLWIKALDCRRRSWKANYRNM